MAQTLIIEKALPIAGRQTPKDILISIHHAGELDDALLSEATAVFVSDAEDLCEALHASLPGGTFSHLLGLMLLKRASHFVVAFGEAEELAKEIQKR